MRPVGSGNYVTSCDLRVFADQTAEPVAAQNTHTSPVGGWMCPACGWLLVQRPVRVGAENRVTLCELDILADQPAESATLLMLIPNGAAQPAGPAPLSR